MPSANLSIYINNTQESDSGRYTCDVLYFGDSGLTSFKGNLLLNVKGSNLVQWFSNYFMSKTPTLTLISLRTPF